MDPKTNQNKDPKPKHIQYKKIIKTSKFLKKNGSNIEGMKNTKNIQT
jgi:hypothetical protein